MALKVPNSMDECLYFTNRLIGDKQVIAWVYRKQCPKCKKAQMGKPVVKGKVKSRAEIYVCPSCSYTEEKIAHEESLMIEAQYTCPSCGKEGEAKVPYRRKKVKVLDEESQKESLAEAVQFLCQHCSGKINVTKKMK